MRGNSKITPLGGYFGVGIPSLSAILTSSATEPAPIFSITCWR